MRLTRRGFLMSTSAPWVAKYALSRAENEAPYTAMGERVGEVTDRSAIVHARLTASAERNGAGYVFPGARHGMSLEELVPVPDRIAVEDLEGACRGIAGQLRILYGEDPGLRGARRTPWASVDSETDYTRQFGLTQLKPGTHYHYAVETRGRAGNARRVGATGEFRTAPAAAEWRPVRFCVATCQHYVCRDTEGGFENYRSIRALAPDFMAMVGDNVYYDNEPPLATTIETARHHWHRMHSLPLTVEAFRHVPCYWTKDDHDLLVNDCWPRMQSERMAPLTFETGLSIFREQVPMGAETFRRFRWGKGLEIWLTEGRDFRSPNTDPDGPEKTIWGERQREWLLETLAASDADFRVLINPTPIVGPDRRNKSDNHSNAAFSHEGRWFRTQVRERGMSNLFVVCGDRHWQYHSRDPESGLEEFSAGAMSDPHAGGTPGEDPRLHRFHRVGGGFLSVAIEGERGRPKIAFRFHDVKGQVVYETSRGPASGR